jgi:dolichyl-phosphate-mannose--protein O-mannosyl transferase
MNFIALVTSTAEIAIATIILWYIVDLLTTMPENMRMVVKCLIVLVAILVVISMFVGQPMHVGLPANPAPLVR